MAHHTPPAVTPATPIGPDVDLDTQGRPPDAPADLVDDLGRSVLGQSASVGQPDVLGVEVDVGADRRGGCDGGRGAVGHGDHPRSWVGMTWMTSR